MRYLFRLWRCKLITLQDVIAYSDELANLLRTNPSEYVPVFEAAARDVALEYLAQEQREGLDPVQIILSSKFNPIPIRALTVRISFCTNLTVGAVHIYVAVSASPWYCNQVCDDRVPLYLCLQRLANHRKGNRSLHSLQMYCYLFRISLVTSAACNVVKILQTKPGFSSLQLPLRCDTYDGISTQSSGNKSSQCPA